MRFSCTHPTYGTRWIESAAASLIIGRPRPGRPVDLDLSPDALVSRPHARLSYDGGAYWIEDLQSKHGTWLAGQRIGGKVRLAPGAQVRIGETILLLPERVEPLDAAPLAEDGGLSFLLDATREPFAAAPLDAASAPADLRRQLRAFYTFSQIIGVAEHSRQLFDQLLRQLQDAIPGAQRSAVLLYHEGGELLLDAHWPPGEISVSSTWAERACRERKAFIWSAAQQEETPQSALTARVRASLYAPMLKQERLLGVIYADNYERSDAFGADDLELLQAVANQVALFVVAEQLQRDRVRQVAAWARLQPHFSPAAADRMMQRPRSLRPGSDLVEPATVLAARVVARGSAPIDLRSVNDLFATITPTLFGHEAVVDRRTQDHTILGVFGSFDQQEAQWSQAVQCAIATQKRLAGAQDQICIGIGTGALVQTLLDTQPDMADMYTSYEIGLRQLLQQVDRQRPDFASALVYQNRLEENIARARLFGDHELLRVERAEVLHALNSYALATIGTTFNALCRVRDQSRETQNLKSFEYTVLGGAVDEALLVCQWAAPGQIVLSQAVYARVYRLVAVEPSEGSLDGAPLYCVRADAGAP